MKLTRLVVERFGPVRRARVEFGAGLNVLYGPNDLGKSTLAQAIRAALLLPPGSSAHEDFVAWGTDEAPLVELEFQVEPGGRHWRIKKEFGHGTDAKATLSSSADAEVWTQEAKGRKVDGEVRKLLSWGIPEPGGRGGTRGLPQSFLTSVLLARQTDPAAIFNQSIDQDADESGKKLLTHALQALAQDPLFKKALDEAQRHMDEAFTSTGQRKRSRGSPFQAASEAIKTSAAELELRREASNETREVEARIEALTSDRLFAEQARDDAVVELRDLEQGAGRQAERRALEGRLQEAQKALADIEQIRKRVTEGEADERRHAKDLEQAEAHLKKTEARRAACAKRLAVAREELGRLSSGDAARERELARKTLEKELLQLEAEKTAANAIVGRARDAGALAQAADEHREKIAGLEERMSELRKEAEAAGVEKESAETLREQLAGVALYEQWRRAVSEAEGARESHTEAGQLLEQAAALRKREAAALGATSERKLPSPDSLKKLRRLHEQRIEAEARRGGGLAVRVRVKRPLNIKVSQDGGPEKLHRGVKQRRSFEAESELSLDIGGVAEVEVSAGEADARDKADKLKARWEETGAPHLAAAGVASMEKLEDACRNAEEAQRTAADLRRQAADLEKRANQLQGVGSKADELAARAKTREKAITSYDRDALELLSKRLGPDRDADVERLRAEAQEQASRTDRRREECARRVAVHDADLKALTSTLADTAARHDEALAALGGKPWDALLQSASSTVQEVEARHAAATTRLEALAHDKSSAVENAERIVQDIEGEVADATDAVKAAVEQKEDALRKLAGTRGELKARRQRAEATDRDGATRSVAELSAELEKIEAPDPAVTEEDLKEARHRLDLATRLARERVDEIKKLEGALEQVGGDIAKEREKMAQEAVTRAKERESELDLDYGAWRLLLETLREVEGAESAHLGRALVEPVSQRFQELTDGRYGKIDVEPGLKTKGIQASGDTRELDALSAGLRDQLATLFRLSVAEHLKSLLVLDDQLAQTDPRRVDWFSEVLRGCSERIQIVVLTCRPQEFLAAHEMGSAGAPVRSSASGLLRAIDLEQLIDRA